MSEAPKPNAENKINHELSDRKQKILSIIIDAYVETAEPVGSRTIAKKCDLDISAATIRNEMSDLEEAGLVTHPHTSAGRIPTDHGYRYFIDHLLPREKLAPHLTQEISREFTKKIRDLDDLMERASKVLSVMTEQTGMVSYPEVKDLSFCHLNLQKIDARHILVLWLTSSGVIQNQLLDLGEDVPETQLKQISNFFNQELAGMPFNEMPNAIRRRLANTRDSLSRLYEQALQIALETLQKIDAAKLCLEGSSHILEKPEFRDIDKTRLLLQTLEQKERLLQLLRQNGSGDGVNVHIGRENKIQEIWDCSIITASYKMHGKTVGMVGILGPSRMRYGTIMSFADYVAGQLSQALEKWY